MSARFYVIERYIAMQLLDTRVFKISFECNKLFSWFTMLLFLVPSTLYSKEHNSEIDAPIEVKNLVKLLCKRKWVSGKPNKRLLSVNFPIREFKEVIFSSVLILLKIWSNLPVTFWEFRARIWLRASMITKHLISLAIKNIYGKHPLTRLWKKFSRFTQEKLTWPSKFPRYEIVTMTCLSPGKKQFSAYLRTLFSDLLICLKHKSLLFQKLISASIPLIYVTIFLLFWQHD